MLYVDTGCLLKLYYPEWNSAAVAAAVAGEEVCLMALHELEMATALELRVFRSEAAPEQAAEARAAVEEDVRAGKLVRGRVTGLRRCVKLGNSPCAILPPRAAVRLMPCIALSQCCSGRWNFSPPTRANLHSRLPPT